MLVNPHSYPPSVIADALTVKDPKRVLLHEPITKYEVDELADEMKRLLKDCDYLSVVIVEHRGSSC